jgi:hypothetical protein
LTSRASIDSPCSIKDWAPIDIAALGIAALRPYLGFHLYFRARTIFHSSIYERIRSLFRHIDVVGFPTISRPSPNGHNRARHYTSPHYSLTFPPPLSILRTPYRRCSPIVTILAARHLPLTRNCRRVNGVEELHAEEREGATKERPEGEIPPTNH